MARKPRPSEIAKKRTAGTKAPAAGRKPAASKPGQKAVGQGKAPVAKVMKLPPKTFVTDLLDTQLQIAADIQSRSGEMGSAVKEAADKKQLDKKAFGITKSLEKLRRANPAKFQVTWEHLKHYSEAAKFQEHADRQGQLELRNVPDEDAEAETADEGETQTKPEDEAPAGTDGSSSPRMRLVGAMSDAIEQDDKAKVA
jgi:hypothetical protein